MSNSGAKAALKGYRLQALYILSEILINDNSRLVFQPEGHEDLAIYQDDKLIKTIQIKNRSEPLSLSDFSPKKEESFFRRAVALIENNPDIIVEVVSYGEIGIEIQNAWINGNEKTQETIINKLEKNAISKQKTLLLLNAVKWRRVSENKILENTNQKLKSSMTAGSPEDAFSLLTWWLYIASENKVRITYIDLIDKINSIGKYFAQRASYHAEWFKAITPLVVNQDNKDLQQLSNEYYKGVSTRFSHIQADLDIVRDEQLQKIHKLLENNKVIIIHGASGQGKTTLAYRYLYDFIPEEWRFQINYIESKNHAKSMSLAVADHLSVFNATLYVYIDVSPNDKDWTMLVKSLLDQVNIKIIITIREEDLARQDVGNEEIGFPATLSTTLRQQEAEKIYTNLVNKGVVKNLYPTSSQAWTKFGKSGSLLEYVYFLTQTESLREKLFSQIKRLEEEIRQNKLEPQTIVLLHICAIATAFEARIQIADISQKLNLKDSRGTFRLLEHEYLLRESEDKRHVEAIHPIRSTILVELLTDEAFSPWIDAVKLLIPCLVEEDLEVFLLYTFADHPERFNEIFLLLENIKLSSWQGVLGICHALIWHGIHLHIHENIEVIDETKTSFGNDAWWMLLFENVAKLDKSNPLEDMVVALSKNNAEKLALYYDLRNKLTTRAIIFNSLKQWLENISLDLPKPITEKEWYSFGEILLWAGYLGIKLNTDIAFISNLNVEKEFKSIEALASLTLGVYLYKKNLYQEFINTNKQIIERIFQQSTNTLWIEYKPSNPIAHYIVSLKEIEQNGHDKLHKLSGYRAYLLRKLFPDNDKFGGIGYGHQVYFDTLPIDNSHKPCITKENLPITQLVKINAYWWRYGDYIYRPNSWEEYTNKVLEVREQIINGLKCLTKNLISYFKKNKAITIIGNKIDAQYWMDLARIDNELPVLPKLVVDKWGFTTEGGGEIIDDDGNSKLTINCVAIQNEYEKYMKSIKDYVSCVSNFIQKSKDILMVNSHLGRSLLIQQTYLLDQAKELGLNYTESTIKLSVQDLFKGWEELSLMQRTFEQHFINIVDSKRLSKLVIKEKETFDTVWPLWFQFCYHPEKHWKDNPEIRIQSIMRNTENNLINTIQSSLEKNLPTSIKFSIFNEKILFNNKKSLWITLDGTNPEELFQQLSNIESLLANAIKPLNYTDLKYFVLMKNWEQLVIVPLSNNRTFSNLAWVIPCYLFVGQDTVNNHDWLKLPWLLDKEIIHYFKLEEMKKDYHADLSKLVEKLQGISHIVNHISCFSPLNTHLNEVAQKILCDYLSSYLLQLKNHINKTKSFVEKFKKSLKNEQLPIKVQLVDLLDSIDEVLCPFDMSDSGKTEFSLLQSNEWIRLIADFIEQLITMQWMFESNNTH